MNEHIFSEIIRGNFEHVKKDKSKIVRIFMSSTFSDTHTERDYLIANVYPRLKSYCKTEYNCDFQIIDMRWGISHELTNSHQATTICLNEIKISQQQSLGPNFIVLLSHRYGTVCLPTRIIENEYEILKAEILAEKKDLTFSYQYGDKLISFENILDECYELDKNEQPARYRLKYLDRLFPNINQKETEFSELWNKLEKKLGDILREAAKICLERKKIDTTQYERYFVSVTEKEIFNGVIKGKDLKNNVLFFEREIEDIESHVKEGNKSLINKFIELDKNSNVDLASKKLLDDLKYRKIPSKLPSSNIFKFKIKWDKNEGVSLQTHQDYVKDFGDTFYHEVKMLIDRNQAKQNTFQALNKEDAILIQVIKFFDTFHSTHRIYESIGLFELIRYMLELFGVDRYEQYLA